MFIISEDDKKWLIKMARQTLQGAVEHHHFSIDNPIPTSLQEHCGAFVSLYKNEKLRGCIGLFNPTIPLYKVVQEMTIASACKDHRFNPVDTSELKDILIEISVLTPLRKINSIDEIEMGKHGIYIKKGSNTGTFLPQVATETGWSLIEFLGYCSQDKAGIGWDGWKYADLFIYEAIIIKEYDINQ